MSKRPLKRSSELTQTFLQDPDYAALYHAAGAEEIGASLRAVREQRGLSQQQVADKMGVSRSRISQIESSEGITLSLEVLTRYAHAVGCRLNLGLVSLETQQQLTQVFVPNLLTAITEDDQSLLDAKVVSSNLL
ncbi:MAG: helix-turn-helix transcriptional regulator [Deinococcota bacterium]